MWKLFLCYFLVYQYYQVMVVTGGCMSRLFVDAMPPFVGTWDLVVGKGGILLGFSRNSLLRCAPLSTPTLLWPTLFLPYPNPSSSSDLPPSARSPPVTWRKRRPTRYTVTITVPTPTQLFQRQIKYNPNTQTRSLSRHKSLPEANSSSGSVKTWTESGSTGRPRPVLPTTNLLVVVMISVHI